MKRLLLTAILAVITTSALAQIKVIEVNNEADTLIYMIRGIEGEYLELYNSPQGFFMLVNTERSIDPNLKFYIGKNKQQSVKSLEILNELTNSDIGSASIIEDAIGTIFETKTAYQLNRIRRPDYIKSDRLLIRHHSQIGWMTIKPKGISELIVFLSN